ncbi:ABC transporter ATP-binding protein [Tibeticola sp.]|uniref:ABC transporter ATP-binding protein n=1 Tax=Tibeticola sp. TaxID=2005368 RepID=UPI0025D2F282|nr:ABC transporter ATP-binding protein [Tibeticola sp.]
MSIRIEAVAKRYGNQAVLQDMTLEVQSGELLTLLGASGSGKTTLLRILAGLERADAGRIVLDDTVVQDGGAAFVPTQRRGLGMVFQSYALWPHLDVAGNLALALREQGVPRADIEVRTEEALRTVGLAGLQRRAIHQLSGGQQQRVALARALVARPRLLLMDEPLSNLDAGLREELRGEIRALQQRLGITTVFVTHDQTEALAMSDRIALLHQGRLVELGAPDAVYRQPRTAYAAAFLGKANVLRGTWDGRALRVGAVSVAAPALQGMSVDAAAAVMIRPQALRWAQGAEAAGAGVPGTVLPARVVRDHLLGALREYQLEVPTLGMELTLVELSGEARRSSEQSIVLPAADVHPLHEG